MVSPLKYDPFIEHLANMEVDLFGNTHTYRAIIHTDAPANTTDDVIGNVTQIGSSNGYPGTNTIGFTSTRTPTSTITMTATDVVWTATGGNLGASTTGRYISIYNDTHASDILMHSYDYGATFTIADTETLTLDFGTTFATLI